MKTNRQSQAVFPRGIVSHLPESAARKRQVEERILSVFAQWGFQEIIPGAFEFFDQLQQGTDDRLLEDSYKLTDRGSGRVMVLRPDVTLQIARIAATTMAGAPRPLRLCYRSSAYRYEDDQARKNREVSQVGVELLGLEQPEADAEMVAIAVESLERAGLRSYQIALGQAAFVRGMIERPDLGPEPQAAIREAVLRKDLSQLEAITAEAHLSPAHRQGILELPRLFGKEEILDRAEAVADNPASKGAVANLREVYRFLRIYGLDRYVVMDLGEARGFDYYTGILFEVFAEGVGQKVGGGGRYDRLIGRFGEPCPATGFALDVDLLLEALERQRALPEYRGPDFLIVDLSKDKTAALELAKRLRKRGYRAARDIIRRDLEGSIAYAKESRIAQVLVLGSRGAKPDEAVVIDCRSNERKKLKIKKVLGR